MFYSGNVVWCPSFEYCWEVKNLAQVNGPYHLVSPRPWPIRGGIGGITLAVGLVAWFHCSELGGLILGGRVILLTIFQWWRDVIREGTFLGFHTRRVVLGLRYGIVLFIVSEVLFFFAFFWAFFHRRLAPTPELGCCWPPIGIEPLNPFSVPLLNTAVLLASGVSVTWAHHRLIQGDLNEAIQGLIATVLLGGYFTLLQLGEYKEVSFTIADRVYGSIFFVATGFHGLHVLIGTTFLIVILIRTCLNHFRSGHHFGFEAAAWYWHFVDVVWIFLFLCIYWWGS